MKKNMNKKRLFLKILKKSNNNFHLTVKNKTQAIVVLHMKLKI